MNIQIPGLDSKVKFKIDFSLVPLAIILIEFAVYITQLPGDAGSDHRDLIMLRILHTFLMLILAFLVSQIYMRTNMTEQNFMTLAITGIVVIAVGDLLHTYLATLFGIELVSIYRRLGIILIQGGLWFPAFIIFGGNRKELLRQFKEYENRLISATRAQSRTSLEFNEVQKEIQSRIREEFYGLCTGLKESIAKVLNTTESLEKRYAAIAPYLAGESLRKLSRELDLSSSNSAAQVRLSKTKNSIRLFMQQFRVLYSSIIQTSPLRVNSYALVLIALVTPPLVNFYSIKEFLMSYPILLISIYVLSYLIVNVQSKKSQNALKWASILIYITGLLPLVVNLVGQAITHNPQTQFPILITALALPITYYISMELLQVLRPSALSLISKDELIASEGLERNVQKIVRDDFSQTISHQWAVSIHGKTLTRLAATSLKLKAAAIAGDSRTFDENVQGLITFLSTPDAEFEERSSDLQAELSSRLDPWRGFVDIKLSIAQELKMVQSARVRVIGEVIEELLSNSIRHGKAKVIELHVTAAGDKEIDVLAIDNSAVAPDKFLSRSGLGTRIFNLASDGRWSITRVGATTEFRLRMSVEK
jgi:hypothetical protein